MRHAALRKKSSRWWTLFYIAVLILVLFAAMHVLFRNRSSSTPAGKAWKAVEAKKTTELRVLNNNFDLEPKPPICESSPPPPPSLPSSAIGVDVQETATAAAKHALDEFQNGRISNAVECLARASSLCGLSPPPPPLPAPQPPSPPPPPPPRRTEDGACSKQLASTIAAWHRLFAPLSPPPNAQALPSSSEPLQPNAEPLHTNTAPPHPSSQHRILHNLQAIKPPDLRSQQEGAGGGEGGGGGGGGGGFGAVWEGGVEEVMVWDGALSTESCKAIIEMFEAETQQQGGVVKGGHVVEDPRVKRDLEISVNNASLTDPRWGKVERLLFGALAKHFTLYEQHNPGLRLLRSPLGDEGFRIKKYKAAPDNLHNYHLDSGDEGGGARRVVAWLLYLNDVLQGGETAFLSQRLRVAPRCGRVLMFPTSFSFVHAGYPPVSGDKYNAISFITIPN